ncbi:CoA ester lyase [Verticiella sediminum]|uniref:CoA ester lyase n=1 Tax=Verticiella sediminum TaxID=1247510 RepID=A0A556ACE8_9BURK|nr:CoA ester lyase [Verticiella sediminum]TSH90566.1 CoA ester lyase [Verticiella sediminum]
MTIQPQRLRRVQLAVPGSSEKMMKKAAASDADHVFLDLEDAVAPVQKADARRKIVEAINTYDWGRKTVCVRINDLSTEYAHQDIIEIVEGAGRRVDTLMMTKVKSAADIYFADVLLSQLEKKHGLERRIGLEALIEEVEGMQNVEEIARASDRLEALIFGMGDFSASMGVYIKPDGKVADYPGDIWHYARFRMVMACRAAGIDAVDGPYADFRNQDLYLEECRRGLALGCVGKWAIHPAQIEWALSVFTPDAGEVARLRRLAAAYAEAEAQGQGAIQVDGTMVDAASIRMFGATLRKADLIGM